MEPELESRHSSLEYSIPGDNHCAKCLPHTLSFDSFILK